MENDNFPLIKSKVILYKEGEPYKEIVTCVTKETRETGTCNKCKNKKEKVSFKQKGQVCKRKICKGGKAQKKKFKLNKERKIGCKIGGKIAR